MDVLGYKQYCIFSGGPNSEAGVYWLYGFYGITDAAFINAFSDRFNLRGGNQSFIDFMKQMILDETTLSDKAFGVMPTPDGWSWRFQLVDSNVEFIWLPGDKFIIASETRLDESFVMELVEDWFGDKATICAIIPWFGGEATIGTIIPWWLKTCLQHTAWVVHRLDDGNSRSLETITPFVYALNGDRLPIINKNIVELCNMDPSNLVT